MPTTSTPLTRTLRLIDPKLYSKWDALALMIEFRGGMIGIDEAENYPDAIDKVRTMRLDSEIVSIRVVGSRAGKPRTLFKFDRPTK